MPKIDPDAFMLAYCTGGHLTLNFHLSITQMQRREPRFVGEIPKQGLYVPQNREELAAAFHGKVPKEIVWLLMCDTDISWLHDLTIPSRMIAQAKALGALIFSAFYVGYCVSSLPGELLPEWFDEMPEGSTTAYTSVRSIEQTRPQRLGAAGMGMCLIHRDALDAMHEAYKDEMFIWFGHDPMLENGKLRPAGEDLTFCDRAAKLGIQTWGDYRIQVAHHKGRVETADTFWQAEERRYRPISRPGDPEFESLKKQHGV